MKLDLTPDPNRSPVPPGLPFGPPSRVTARSSRRRVLVVDDEALIRWSLAETLADQNFEVVQAASGAAALAAATSALEPFDLVLLDFRLPDSNDLSLLAKLRHLMPNCLIVLMTAFRTPEIAQAALDLGVYRVLDKPFELSEIAGITRQLR